MRIVLVPSSQGCLEKNQGCEKAPEKIAASVVPNSFESVDVVPNNLDATNQKIFEKAKDLLGQEKVLFLGGDHSITFPLFKAFAEKFQGKKIGLVCFDAHADCAQYFKPPSHEDWLRVLVEEKFIAPENVLFIGTRKIYPVEAEWLAKHSINFLDGGLEDLKKFLEKIEVVYLSLDIDVFDPEIVSGTGYLEPKGMREKDFFEFLAAIMKSKKVKAADLVEVNPEKDVEGETVKLASKITRHLIQLS